MFENIFEKLGLSPNEAKIYEVLLELKESGAGEISSKAKVHRRNVYDAVNRLIDKGLIFPILTKGENLYSPVDPDKLMELVKEKETELNKILPQLRKIYEAKSIEQEAYIYRGAEGFKNFVRDVLRVGKDIYTIGGKLAWLDPGIKNYTEQALKEIRRKKMNFYILFDAEVKKGKDSFDAFGKNYKFLPAQFSTDSTISIFGDYIVNYTGMYIKKIDDNGTMFVIRDQKLADSYRSWFDFMWDKCEKNKE